jgi:hypothetical protein
MRDMSRKNQKNTVGCQAAAWRVFVGFDSLQAQKRATEMCEFLTRRFRPEFDFDLRMCDFNSIGETECRQQAIQDAATARIVIFATSAKQALTPTVMEWMEGMCAKRHLREGALVGLVCGNAPAELRDSIEMQLRQLARRAGLDYLTHEPDCRALTIQEEPEWVDARAAKVGSVLEGILSTPGGSLEVLPSPAL